MSSYSPPESSFQQTPNTPQFVHQYPEVPPPNSPRAPVPPGYYSNQDLPSQQTPTQQTSASKANGDQNRSANRLRKACDNCSIRKVKCDESQPCKACQSLEINCTFNRPSKRRGPPNRLAENLKKQQKTEDAVAASAHAMGPASPTFQSAQALAAFSQQHVYATENIAPPQVLDALINDFFTYIHPVIPVPHEPTFRQTLTPRGYPAGGMPLALTASMVSCLTASFPRCVRKHLRDYNLEQVYPSSMSFIERCQKVGEEAHPVSFHRELTVYDAIISYLRGVTSIYTFQREPAILHYKQCIGIIQSLKVHRSRPETPTWKGVPTATMTTNGSDNGPSVPIRASVVDLEMERRVFWLVFSSVRTLEQLGVQQSSLSFTPSYKSDPWPELPTEIDDQYIQTWHSMEQPHGLISEMVGFTINSKLFESYDAVSRREIFAGVDELVDWDVQKRELQDSLKNVRKIVENLPPFFQLHPASNHPVSAHNYPDPEPSRSHEQHAILDDYRTDDTRTMMLNIQKANIHATQLGTRSYLVEKYYTLGEIYDRQNVHSNTVAPSLKDSDDLDEFMKAEYVDILHSVLDMISSIKPFHMEPNGPSLISKIRSITRTLLDGAPTKRKSLLPHNESEDYLKKFVNILMKIETTVVVSREENYEDDDSKLRRWTDLGDEQKRFLEGFGRGGP